MPADNWTFLLALTGFLILWLVVLPRMGVG